jgi:predicted SAM-dependent methyltransferase
MRIFEKIKNYFHGINDQNLSTTETMYCICCNSNFGTFLPFGIIRRENALCPVCGSLERHRLHWHYMKSNTNLFSSEGKKLKLLHVAPETIFYNQFITNNRIDYFPCDKFEKGYENAYSSETLNVDITNIQFEDNTFDVIYCSHVLEHVIDDKKAMKELFRILKPGGWALLQVPLDNKRDKTYEDYHIITPEEREKAFGQKDHVRIYGKDYKEKLEHAGFQVKVDNYLKKFTEEEIIRNGFMEGEEIYFCFK